MKANTGLQSGEEHEHGPDGNSQELQGHPVWTPAWGLRLKLQKKARAPTEVRDVEAFAKLGDEDGEKKTNKQFTLGL